MGLRAPLVLGLVVASSFAGTAAAQGDEGLVVPPPPSAPPTAPPSAATTPPGAVPPPPGAALAPPAAALAPPAVSDDVVGVLLAAAVWALRRTVDGRRGKQALSVESALSLGDKRSLVIVAVEGRRLLVGVSPGSVSLVTELHAGFQETLDQTVSAPQTGSRA